MKYEEFIQKHPSLFRTQDSPLEVVIDPKIIAAWQESRRSYLKDRKLPEQWANIGIVMDDPYMIAIRDLVRFPSDKLGGYIRLFNRSDLEGSRAVAALTQMKGAFVLIKQFRHATQSWHWEIPRGFGTVGLTDLENVRKEVYEELNGSIEEIQDLGFLHYDSGLRAGTIHLYFARLSSINSQCLDPNISEFKSVTSGEIEGMIANGVITDSFTICAYARAKLKGLLIED